MDLFGAISNWLNRPAVNDGSLPTLTGLQRLGLGQTPEQKAAIEAQAQADFAARQKQAQDLLAAARNLPNAVKQYAQTWQGIPQQIQEQPEWQKWLGVVSPATQMFTNPIVQKAIGDITRGEANITSATIGQRPLTQTIEQWSGQQPETTLPWQINPFTGKPATISKKDLYMTVTPDLLLGMGAPFKIVGKATPVSRIVLNDVSKLLAKGTAREAILELMTKTVRYGEKFKPAEAESIVKFVENEVAKTAEKIGIKAPVEAQTAQKAGEAVKPIATAVEGTAKGGTVPPVKPPIGIAQEIPQGMRESEHFRKVNARYNGELGDNPLYTKVNMADEAEKAIKYVDNNIDKARNRALSSKVSDNPILDTKISAAYSEKVRAAGDIDEFTKVENALSMRLTREGQDIAAARGLVNDNSPTHFIRQVIKARMEQVGNKLPKTAGKPTAPASRVTQQIDREVQKLNKMVNSRKLNMMEAQRYLEEWACK